MVWFPSILINADYISNTTKVGASVSFNIAFELTIGTILGLEGGVIVSHSS